MFCGSLFFSVLHPSQDIPLPKFAIDLGIPRIQSCQNPPECFARSEEWPCQRHVQFQDFFFVLYSTLIDGIRPSDISLYLYTAELQHDSTWNFFVSLTYTLDPRRDRPVSYNVTLSIQIFAEFSSHY